MPFFAAGASCPRPKDDDTIAAMIQPPAPPNPLIAPRPPLWLLAIIFAASGLDLLALINLINNLALYRQLSLPFALTGWLTLLVVWLVLLLGLGLALLARRPVAWRLCPLILGGYGVFHWVWLAAFARADYDRGRLAAQAMLTLLLLLPVGWLAWRYRQQGRA
jgi:hypothetical protein